jgi:hypothetical protein
LIRQVTIKTKYHLAVTDQERCVFITSLGTSECDGNYREPLSGRSSDVKIPKPIGEPKPKPTGRNGFVSPAGSSALSARHSKVACWGVAFDLLATSQLTQRHAAEGKIVLGVNHKMVDYVTGRKKKLDAVVVARPEGQPKCQRRSGLRAANGTTGAPAE